MSNYISIKGIETNNLKNIDVKLKKNSLNLIIGPSGSGKSSLAYNTISEVGLHEYLSMFSDDICEPSYIVREYKNMIPTVPISQNNYNRNIKSTIGTYFGLNSKISIIFASLLNMEPEFFILNKEANTCDECHGLGYVEKLDELKLINYNVPLANNPFRCWKRYSDFYERIIVKFCEEMNIDSRKSFSELTAKEQNIILYGIGEKKHQIRYKHNRSVSTRTSKFYGIMTMKPMRRNYEPSQKFFSKLLCPNCNGMKYSKKHLNYKLSGKSIGEVMITPLEELENYFNTLYSDNSLPHKIILSIDSCLQFIKKTNELNLSHLFLNRSIPTLSGGELQRLRLVQVFNSQLSDLMIVLDEPVAGLSGDEKKIVFNHIVKLAEKHTLIVIDHSSLFVNEAKNIIALGHGGGENGGEIIDSQKYLDAQKITLVNRNVVISNLLNIKLKANIHSYSGVNVSIADRCTNIITGKSGIGKSTLLKEYFSRYFEEYTYINQNQIIGNNNSSVATLLKLSSSIFDIFANKYEKQRDFFTNSPGKEGSCQTCNGNGELVFKTVKLICKECGGTGFNSVLNNYRVLDKNLLDIWGMTINEGYNYFEKIDSKVAQSLKVAKDLALGHLKIGQATSTLSGGENVRIKLFRLQNSKARYIGIDEPFKGLNPTEVSLVMKFILKLKNKDKTIIVVDHSEMVTSLFDKHIVLSVKDCTISEKAYE